eukprot:g26639.t1
MSTGALLGTAGLSSGAYAAGDDVLKVGLIGCGGRGTGAAKQALLADKHVKLHAMGDVFKDRLKKSLEGLKREPELPGKLDVPAERQFVGFDAYKDVLNSGVDVVILTTPPHFRPMHLKAAIEAGKHVFAEKPVAVDAPGVRSVLETCKLAKKERLSVVSGLCLRYHGGFAETVERIHDGAIGEIHTLQANDYRGPIWMFPRQREWTDMHWQMRNWYYFTWLSGDFNVEQHVHYLDTCAWAMGGYPIRAIGMGGRQVRWGTEYGNIYDHHSVVYEYENGARFFSNTRQQPGCFNNMSARATGSKGIAHFSERRNGLHISGKTTWRDKGGHKNMYQVEHDRMFAGIRSGNPLNNGEYMAQSTLLAIMGRMATYTGKAITWQQAMNSKEDLSPAKYAWGPIEMPEAGLGGLTLPGLLHAEQARAAQSRSAGSRSGMLNGKAKACILVYLWGGPPQQDTFDMKPRAPAGIRSQFGSIDTAVPGIQICDQLPQIAKHTDKMAIVRSYTHPSNRHEVGVYHTLTGKINNNLAVPRNQRNRRDFPHPGSVISYFSPPGGMPATVTVPRPIGHDGVVYTGTYAGFLGPRHDPMELKQSGEVQGPPPHSLELPKGLSDHRLLARKGLLETLEDCDRRLQKSARFSTGGLDHFRDQAFRMLTAPSSKGAFKVEKEPDKVRDRYGRNEYGEAFLMSRRLIEAGVRLVTLTWYHIAKKDGNVLNEMSERRQPFFNRSFAEVSRPSRVQRTAMEPLAGEVHFGSRVTVKDLSDGTEEQYELGHSSATGLPTQWSPTKNVRWSVPIAGEGWSSPVVLKGKIYLTSAVKPEGGKGNDRSLRTLCLDAVTGTEIWNVEVFKQSDATTQRVHRKNSHASPTPITDGKHLFVHFGTQGTACLTLDGKVVWKMRELKYRPQHGNGGSPVLVEGMLFVSCDGSDIQYVAAIDAKTGKIRWKKDRPPINRAQKFSFTTPLVIEVGGKKQIVSPGTNQVIAYEPKTGNEIWKVAYTGYSVIPRPVYAHGLLFISTSYNRPKLLAIRPTGTGDVTNSHVAWSADRGAPHTPSALVVGDELYVVSDRGVASCFDAKTGKNHWSERLGGNYSASPVLADGKIYFQSEQGDTTVVQPGTKFKVLGKNKMRERTLASYAVADSAIFLRDDGQIVGFAGMFGIGMLHPPPAFGGKLIDRRIERADANLFDDFVQVQVVEQPVTGEQQSVSRREFQGRTDLDSHFGAADAIGNQAGEQGVAVGGGFRVYTDTDSDWGTPQFVDPQGAEYTTIASPAGVSTILRTTGVKSFRVVIHGRALEPGEEITVTIGDQTQGSPGSRAQTFYEEQRYFWFDVDTTGDGSSTTLADSPSLKIVGDEAVCLKVTAPSMATVDEDFRVLLKLEDRWGNPVESFRGTVKFSQPELTVDGGPVTFTEQDGGAKWVEGCRLNRVGVVRLAASVVDSPLSALSNPIVCTKTAGDLTLQWADPHGGQLVKHEKIAGFFRYARDVSGLQFVGYQRNADVISAEDWEAQQHEERAFYEPGRFVPIPGYEWSGKTWEGGHHNVYLRRHGLPVRRNMEVEEMFQAERAEAELPHIRDVYAAYRNTDTIITPHVGGEHSDITFHDPTLEPAVEVSSSHGSFEWMIEDVLRRGYRLGFLGGSDCYTGRPGDDRPGYQQRRYAKSAVTGMYVKDVSLDSFFEAMRARRVFATTGARIVMSVDVDGRAMGELYSSSEPATLTVAVAGTAPLESVELYRGLDVAYSHPLEARPSKKRLRILWNGSSRMTSYSGVIWDGSLRIDGGTIAGVETMRFDSPRSHIRDQTDTTIDWHAWGCGYRMGLIVELEEGFDREAATLHVRVGSQVLTGPLFRKHGDGYPRRLSVADAEQGDLAIRLCDLDKGPVAMDLGVLDRSVAVDWAPEGTSSMADFCVRETEPRPGINEYWLKEMRKLIVGCGYLGRRVADLWLAAGDRVTATTRSPARADEWRAGGIEPIVADVTRPETLQELEEYDTVLYAVGYDRGGEPTKAEVYIEGLDNVLTALGGKCGRFVYISSTSVYGQNEGEQVDEDSECTPTTEGGRICLDAEAVVWRHFREGANSASKKPPAANVLRCAGLYGPGRLLRRVEQLQSAEPIGGNPEAYLNLIHIDDAAAAVSACENYGEPDATYLVCDGESLTRREYYETLAELAGAASPLLPTMRRLIACSSEDVCEMRAHAGVGLDVLQLVEVENSHLPASETVGNAPRNLGFGENDQCAVFLNLGQHLLPVGLCLGAAFFRFGLRDLHVGLGLFGLQACADVSSDVDVGDVDRNDFECGVRLEALCENQPRDRVGVLENLLVTRCRADRLNDSLADAGDDRFFGGAADNLFQVDPHGHAGTHEYLNAVSRHRFQRLVPFARVGAVDHAGVDAGLHGFEEITPGEIDRLRRLPVDGNIGPVGGDQRGNHVGNVSPRQGMRLQVAGGDRIYACDARLHRHDLAADNHRRIHLTQAHHHQLGEGDIGPRHAALNPQADIAGHHGEADQCHQHDNQRDDQNGGGIGGRGEKGRHADGPQHRRIPEGIPLKSFDELKLIEPLRRAIAEEKYETPTEIQARAIPDLLAGRDVLGSAQTGTGKTAAFALPILNRLGQRNRKSTPNAPRVLVLAPTRELAIQIGESFKTYGRHLRVKQALVYGGVSQVHQVRVLNRGAHVLVATPGRLLDLMNQGHIDLSQLEVFVLDEADRMLDMGFLPDLKRIIATLPQKRQSLFFSATLPPKIVQLSRRLLTDPVKVDVAPKSTKIELIEQSVRFVEQGNKKAALEKLLRGDDVGRTLVFTKTKRGANQLAERLNRGGIKASAIHGNKSQAARQRALEEFRSERVQVLVATDVAARGIDVDGVTHVVNYELPLEPENYVHRIGRTGRAGASGIAMSFCSPAERGLLRNIERLIGRKVRVDGEHRRPHAEAGEEQKQTGATQGVSAGHRPRKPRSGRPRRPGTGNATSGAAAKRRRRPRRKGQRSGPVKVPTGSGS